MMSATDFSGKFFSVLGDSVSTFAGYSQPEEAVFYDWSRKREAGIFSPEDTWWGQAIQALGGQLLVNHSISGSTVCRLPEYEIQSYGCSDSRTAALGFGRLHPDVILVFLGINDWGHRVPLHPAGQGNESVFSVAYDRMLKKLRRNYPKAKIFCLTLPPNLPKPAPSFPSIDEYSRVILSCAAAQGCRAIQLPPCETMDGYHPNAAGMAAIADAVVSQF